MSEQQKNRKKREQKREKPEFDQQILDLARVTRVTKGGKQLNFRCCVLLGDKKGRVGYGVQKGADVQLAVDKAVAQAKKNMIRIPIVHDTIPHRVEAKYKAGKVMMKPAPKGSGIIAGSVIRAIFDIAGVPNASAKMLGKTNNKITNVKATFLALSMFRKEAISRSNKQMPQQAPMMESAMPAAKEESTKKEIKKRAPRKTDMIETKEKKVTKAAPKKKEQTA